MPVVKVHPITIPKDKLDRAAEEERLTYLMAGNLANDLQILQKLLVISIHTAVEMGHPHSEAANGSTMLRLSCRGTFEDSSRGRWAHRT